MLSDQEMAERLKEALAEGYHFYSIEDVLRNVKSGEWQWHSYRSGVVITSIGLNRIGEKYLRGHFIFGDMDDVLAQSDEIDQFGRDNGCVKFTMDGRIGWQRVLKDYGWKPTGVIMEKNL